MAIRRTREEKIQIQQRRDQEKFTWKEEAPSKPVMSAGKKKVATSGKKAGGLEKEHHWLRQDLLQTVVSVVVVLAMLAYFYWRSVQVGA